MVRGATEAFAGYDNETALGFYDPDVELHGSIDGHVYRGLDGVREFFGDWVTTWDDYGFEIEEWVDAGGDHVIAAVHAWGRGKQSGAAVDHREAHLWTVRGGKLRELRIFPTVQEALAALGA